MDNRRNSNSNRRKYITDFSRGVIKVIYCVAVFFVFLTIISAIWNQGNNDMTTVMSDAVYPIVSFKYDNVLLNTIHGYSCEMDYGSIREELTPLMPGRKINLYIESFGTEVSGIRYELRDIRDNRLIEDTPVYNYLNNNGIITSEITLKDLIDDHTEYSLCVILSGDTFGEARYYTRIIEADDFVVKDMLQFAYYFSETSFDKVKSKDELRTYMESNSKGDNTTFAHVDIHSSMEQVTWGTMNPHLATDMTAYIREMTPDMAVIDVEYYISTGETDKEIYYQVEDSFRIKTGQDRMHLMEFYRDVEQIFSLSSGIINNNKIVVGITDKEIDLVESQDGNQIAFVNSGRLYSYNITDNKLGYIFGFYEDGEETDPRNGYKKNDVKIFNIDEKGNIYFMVYGYMNRGIHEGTMGMTIYYYDSIINNVEEKMFISYNGGYDTLKRQVETLSYVSSTMDAYIYVGDTIYDINLEDTSVNVLVTSIPYDGIVTNLDSTMVAWVSGGDLYNVSQIIMLNLVTGTQTYVQSGEGNRILPIGFFGNDLIYGVASKEDISIKPDGHTLFPMSKIIIRNEKGDILKEYAEAGIYVVDAKLVEDATMISLTRMFKTGDGFSLTSADQILNNKVEKITKNNIESVVTETFETIHQIALRNPIDLSTMQILTPRQVLFEGNRRLDTSWNNQDGYFRVYIMGKLANVTVYDNDAIIQAFDNNGVVTDGIGREIYRRNAVQARNQIMSITGDNFDDSYERMEVKADCIDTLLALNGKTVNSIMALSRGESIPDIIRTYLDDAYVLDITGCDLGVDIYYLSKDIPVIMEKADGDTILLTGYNEISVVIYSPSKQELYKVDKDTVQKWIDEGAVITTYINK